MSALSRLCRKGLAEANGGHLHDSVLKKVGLDAAIGAEGGLVASPDQVEPAGICSCSSAGKRNSNSCACPFLLISAENTRGYGGINLKGEKVVVKFGRGGCCRPTKRAGDAWEVRRVDQSARQAWTSMFCCEDGAWEALQTVSTCFVTAGN